MSGTRMSRATALAVIEYNHGWQTILGNPKWAQAMVLILSDGGRAECERLGLEYPPIEWLEEYFGDGTGK